MKSSGRTVHMQVLRNKFLDLKDIIAESHPHITDLFDNAHRTPEGKRATEARIMKNCFKKQGSKWVLDLANPFFKEKKQRHLSATWELIKKHVFSSEGPLKY